MDQPTASLDTAQMKCALLMACSRMLMYPDRILFKAELSEVKDGLIRGGAQRSSAVMTALETLLSGDPIELAETYVSTFDLSEGTTLHLTAHEFGDTRERGPALLELAQMYRVLGLVHEDEQLPDYLPQLLEMLVVAIDEQVDAALQDELETRLAKVCVKIRDLLEDGAYQDVFTVLVDTLREPEVGSEETTAVATPGDDEEDMPYPLHYD